MDIFNFTHKNETHGWKTSDLMANSQPSVFRFRTLQLFWQIDI
jgi:hypothetical protein